MAEDKKGFILYADQKELFDQLPNDKAGELIKHIFAYVNDENPITEDLLIKLSFTPIKQQFKRDLKKWEKTREGRSKAGKASAEARKNKKQQASTNSTNVKNVQQSLTNPTVKDNVNVTVNVKDNVKDILLNNKSWIEQIAMKKRIGLDKVKKSLTTFLDDLELKDDLDRPEKDIKQHFVNLLNIELKKEAPVKAKPNYKI